MSKSNAPHIPKHLRFFWEFLEHFKFFDFDQANARKNNYSETPKPPRLAPNWLSSTELAINAEILEILSPNFQYLYFQKPTLPPFVFGRVSWTDSHLNNLQGKVPIRKFALIDGTEWHSIHVLLPPPFSHQPCGVEGDLVSKTGCLINSLNFSLPIILLV